jgi:serine/threonine-protein kinase
MSPEQARGGQATFQSDIFSLGVVLYEMLAGRAPFKRKTMLATMAAVERDPAPPIRGERAEVCEALAAIVERCLEKEERDRFGSAAEVAAALARLA